MLSSNKNKKFHSYLNFNFAFLVLIMFGLVPPVMVHALEPAKSITQYNLQVWNMESGLPANSIYSIQQTRDGYLWLGTQDGLVRFDGLNFEIYNMKTTPQLKSSNIRALHVDKQGILWIGTATGGLTSYHDGKFLTYPTTEFPYLHGIISLTNDRYGKLWIGSTTNGLTCLEKGVFTNFTSANGLPCNEVRHIYKDAQADIWITTSAGIVKLIEPDQFQSIVSRKEIPYFMNCSLHTGGAKLSSWIGTARGGLFFLENGSYSQYSIQDGLPNRTIASLLIDSDDNLWIGTDGGGLSRLRKGESNFHTLPPGDGLDCGFVYSLYEDREKNLWIGTLEGGLHLLRDTKFTIYTRKEGLAHDYVECVHKGPSGILWIGTKAGLNRLEKGALTTVNFNRDRTQSPGNKPPIPGDSILGLFEDPSGYLWIGTLNGLYRYNLADGKTTHFTSTDGLSNNSITYIFKDSRAETWVGTINGLNRLDPNSRTFTKFSKEEGLPSNFIEFIFEDSRGVCWIGTDAGLCSYNEGAFSTFLAPPGLRENYYKCAHEEKDGTLWFGTTGGLIRYKNNKTDLYTYRCGLTENIVYSILEDDKGNLWLGGRNGISQVSIKNLDAVARGGIDRVHLDTYNEIDGMKSRWCTGPGCRTRDGKFIFPTGIGLAEIDPGHLEKNKLVPPIIIEKIMVDGKPLHIHDTNSTRSPGKESKGIKLAPGMTRLEFYYTAITFSNPKKIRFKIKLDGYDTTWLERGNTRSIAYTHLEPGAYSFLVKACNADGSWDEQHKSVTFYLEPFFYQTTWFYFVLGISLALGAYLFHRIKVRQLRIRQKKLAGLVDKRTAALAERTTELETSKNLIESQVKQLQEQSEKLKDLDKVKSRFFANISHEFRTPLTLILGPLEQITASSRKAGVKKTFAMMMRNARRLLGLVDQLLDLSKIDSGKMQLRAAKQNILPFLKGLVQSFEYTAHQNRITIAFIESQDQAILYYDNEKIEKAVVNLLMNAVKFTPPGGSITVTVTISNLSPPAPGYLEISVKDTGLGIPAAKLEYIFDRFFRARDESDSAYKGTGIGLALAKELVELHRGELVVKSEEGQGSEFIIRLPLGDAHLNPGEIVAPPAMPGPSGTVNKADVFPQISDISYLELNAKAECEAEDQEEIHDVEQDEALSLPAPSSKNSPDIILVVEDNADMRYYIRSCLEPAYSVQEAKDGREGIEKAREIIPDLIVSDVMMPRTGGIELCKTLKAAIETSHIPIILLTAKSGEEQQVVGLETGADDYIIKPFSTKALLARIKNLIDLRRLLQQRIQREMTLQPGEIIFSSIDQVFLEEVQGQIEKHISDPGFKVKELSDALFISKSSLYRKLQALTGESPQDFIRSYRLKRAAQLLKKNVGNITEIAYRVGFSSSSYFAKCFKDKFKRSPGAYTE